jgi:hypothetical protein
MSSVQIHVSMKDHPFNVSGTYCLWNVHGVSISAGTYKKGERDRRRLKGETLSERQIEWYPNYGNRG